MTISALPPAPSRMAPTTFSALMDAFLAAMPAFVTEANAIAVALNLVSTTATSVTSLTISAASKSLTVDVAKSFQPGMSVKIARTTSPSNWMHGDVTSYNAGTGALVVNVTNILGSGTYTNWTVTLSSPVILPVFPAGHFNGLALSHAADSDHDITIMAGECRDDTDTVDMVLSSALTKQADSIWAVGTNTGLTLNYNSIDFELMTLDVAPGGDGWTLGSYIVGLTSSQTVLVAKAITPTTYYVHNRSGAFSLGEILTNYLNQADQGATRPIFSFPGGTLLVWLIMRSDTGVVDVAGSIAEISGLTPPLPAGYDYKRLIGAYRINSSSNIITGDWWGNGRDRTFMYDTPILDVSSATPGTNAVTAPLSTPGGIVTAALLNIIGTNFAYVSSLDSNDLAVSATIAPLASAFNGNQHKVLTNTSSQIRYRMLSNVAIYIATIGYEMSL